jgi:hypothetical protein
MLEQASAALQGRESAQPVVRDNPRIAATLSPPPPAQISVEPAPLFPAAPGNPENGEERLAISNTAEPAVAEINQEQAPPLQNEDDLAPFNARLESLGVSDPQLAPWGLSGQLYRFSCRASLPNAPAFTRHFEAVATQPQGAVADVVAKVEAWRNSHTDETAIR